MVFCIVALPVFLILGIFSMRYRILAKESFECIFKMATLRPCQSRIDQRIKSGVSGKLMKKHPKIAKFTYKNFKTISWIFFIIFVASLVFTVWGVVNFAVYGNCNGPVSNSFCILTELEHGLISDNSSAEINNIDGAVECPPSEYQPAQNANTS